MDAAASQTGVWPSKAIRSSLNIIHWRFEIIDSIEAKAQSQVEPMVQKIQRVGEEADLTVNLLLEKVI